MIDLKTYESDIITLRLGQTKRVNHDDCSAGQDRRRRLYLTRPAGSGEVVVAYCHNCQDKGIWKNENTWVPYRDFDVKAPPLPVVNEQFDEPNHLEFDASEWPVSAHIWRTAKGLDPMMCTNARIAYDPTTNRIYLPQYSYLIDGVPAPSGQLEGYQLRDVTGHGPKYLTVHRDKERKARTQISTNRTRLDKVRVGVLVEDLPSGLHIMYACRTTEIMPYITVNYGTSVNPESLHENLDFDAAGVWFDNDHEHVKKQAQKNAKVWALMTGKDISIEDKMDDPKNHPYMTVVAVLRRWVRDGQH